MSEIIRIFGGGVEFSVKKGDFSFHDHQSISSKHKSENDKTNIMVVGYFAVLLYFILRKKGNFFFL